MSKISVTIEYYDEHVSGTFDLVDGHIPQGLGKMVEQAAQGIVDSTLEYNQ